MGKIQTAEHKAYLNYIALDIETTGLDYRIDADRIIEFGAVKFTPENGGTEISRFSELCDPQISIPSEATEIHGITDDMVRGKRTPYEVWMSLLEWAGEDPIFICHNAPFEASFIKRVTRGEWKNWNHLFLCTLELARVKFKGLPSYSLQNLTGREGKHRALDDAALCKDLFLEILNEYKSGRIPQKYFKPLSIMSSEREWEEQTKRYYAKNGSPNIQSSLPEVTDEEAADVTSIIIIVIIIILLLIWIF